MRSQIVAHFSAILQNCGSLHPEVSITPTFSVQANAAKANTAHLKDFIARLPSAPHGKPLSHLVVVAGRPSGCLSQSAAPSFTLPFVRIHFVEQPLYPFGIQTAAAPQGFGGLPCFGIPSEADQRIDSNQLPFELELCARKRRLVLSGNS
jgi:hypothetical protein